jgi:hypothetical protein
MSIVEHSPNSDPWAQRLARWSKRLHAAHLEGLVGALLEAVEPLGPVGAQVLWVAQPTLGRWVPHEEITALAQRLEAPGGVAWLREQLIEMDNHDQ